MKKIILFAFLLVCISCGSNGEKEAAKRLENARLAFQQGDYYNAKIEIDSIKVLFPRAVDARRKGLKLMREVELAEQKQTLVYLDSMMNEKQMAFEAIKERFVLEKDTAYQEIGHYIWPSQVIEKNFHRSYLRFMVSERGLLTMTTIYCGAGHIHHLGVKVIAPDGTFAETPASDDSYETSDMGEKIEKADFPIGKDGNVMGFIYLNHDKNLRIDYFGERKYTTQMWPADRQALKELYELAQILSSIEAIKKEQEEARQKVGFLTHKMKTDSDSVNVE